MNRELYIVIAVQHHADKQITLCMIRDRLPVTLYHFLTRFEKDSTLTISLFITTVQRISSLSYLYLPVKANEDR